MSYENDLIAAHEAGTAAAQEEILFGTHPHDLAAKVSTAVPAIYQGPLRRSWQVGYLRAAIHHLQKPAPCLAPLPIAGSPTDTA